MYDNTKKKKRKEKTLFDETNQNTTKCLIKLP